MQEALALVRRELGPQAAVLHTRAVRARGWLRWLGAGARIEVVASARIAVAARLLSRDDRLPRPKRGALAGIELDQCAAHAVETSRAASDALQRQLADLRARIEDICQRAAAGACEPQPVTLL